MLALVISPYNLLIKIDPKIWPNLFHKTFYNTIFILGLINKYQCIYGIPNYLYLGSSNSGYMVVFEYIP